MSEIKFEKTRFGKFWSGKGFYLVLGVCIVAVGVAAWASYNAGVAPEIPELSYVDELPADTGTSTIDWGADANYPIEDVPYDPPSSRAPESAAPANAEPDEAEPVEKKVSFAYPCGNTILKGYSGDELVFSETMQDWRTHDGIDFTAAKGTQVKSIAAGTVKDITDDEMWGWTVTVEHPNDITAYYCGLQENIAVKAGQKIETGTVIGGVGDTYCEIVEPEHFHLKVTKDKKVINPLDVLGKSSLTES